METTEIKMRPRGLGGSMKPRNVQALAAHQKKLTVEVLKRYIRPEMKHDDMLSGDSSDNIPVINMGKLMDAISSEEEASKLKHACEDWGFFQLVNHGVPEEVIEGMKDNIKGFFDLPLEKREEVAQHPGDFEGYGQTFVFSEEQKLDWADMLYLFTQPPHFRNFIHWPSQPPSFSAHDKVVGLTPHSDGSGLTLLLQVNPVVGLQIRRNGKWLPIVPLPGALVVNIGDALEIQEHRALEHRAVINAKEERISIAAFHGPSFGRTVGPLAEILGDETPLFKSLSMEEYARLFTSQKLDGKSRIKLMKLNP